MPEWIGLGRVYEGWLALCTKHASWPWPSCVGA